MWGAATTCSLSDSTPTLPFLSRQGVPFFFSDKRPLSDQASKGEDSGFPLSTTLLARKAWLGRSARMLAAQVHLTFFDSVTPAPEVDLILLGCESPACLFSNCSFSSPSPGWLLLLPYLLYLSSGVLRFKSSLNFMLLILLQSR